MRGQIVMESNWYSVVRANPVDNTYIESFNGRLRDEYLNINWFLSLEHAREVIGQWQEDYNSIRCKRKIRTSTFRKIRTGSLA